MSTEKENKEVEISKEEKSGIKASKMKKGRKSIAYLQEKKDKGEKIVQMWNEAGVAVHLATGYNAHCREWTCKPIGMADDIAPLSVYLASDESSFVNSASIIIDGGVCLG